MDNAKNLLPLNSAIKDDKHEEMEKERINELEIEKVKILKEMEELKLELERKSKDYYISEIKNEILKKMVFDKKLKISIIS